MSQNSPFVNASPTTPSNLENFSGVSKGFSNIVGNLKTTEGDISISLENVMNSLDVETFTEIFLDSISQNIPTKLLFNAHNIIFISPELADLEIQIGELLNELFHLDTQDNINNSQLGLVKLNTYESDSLKTPFQLLSSLNSLKDSQKSQIVSKQIPSSIKPTNLNSAEKSKPNQQANYFEKELSSLKKEETTYINIQANFLTNKEEKIASPLKQEKEQQHKQEEKEQQHKHKQQEDKEYQKQEKKKLSKIREININSISIEEVNPYNTLKNFKKVDNVSPCLKKKLVSPLKVFNASYSNKKISSTTNKKIRVENIFVKFMQLMAKILGQSEAEAHELYLKIKERTDNVDLLTLLLSKVNSEQEDINWEDNEEMKLLVNKARQCGVDIPNDKYTWTEEEKKLLKENIQMRKDSLEKITQLERTDMQRYLQEVSQCHQTRSNVLKLLKEVIDTFIYNLRP